MPTDEPGQHEEEKKREKERKKKGELKGKGEACAPQDEQPYSPGLGEKLRQLMARDNSLCAPAPYSRLGIICAGARAHRPPSCAKARGHAWAPREAVRARRLGGPMVDAITQGTQSAPGLCGCSDLRSMGRRASISI